MSGEYASRQINVVADSNGGKATTQTAVGKGAHPNETPHTPARPPGAGSRNGIISELSSLQLFSGVIGWASKAAFIRGRPLVNYGRELGVSLNYGQVAYKSALTIPKAGTLKLE